ncbi:hypothetical protein HDE68_004327 [Pedobacter cryoconitis]|uniref:Uncharacterized protein n=1 Tax=Pedobacter cryoconitis TaxID=188932 RepID=A0A7W8ZQX3_9SPHI|nr:hypothetical protein [Pedobacter cryoconitis]MBB5638398.1 hypothetical protein [Pedobacter cryoconitis]
MKPKAARNILLSLLAFLGFGAIGGGGALIVSPTGTLIGMPPSILKNSPFHSFLIPGIILFALLGLGPLLVIPALLKKPTSKLAEKLNCFKDMHWSWTFSIYTAFILVAWIQLEMVFIQTVSWMHTFYMFLASVIILVSLTPTVRSLYKNHTN